MQEPAVHQEIEGVVGSPDLDRAQEAVPGSLDFPERRQGSRGRAVRANQPQSVSAILALAQEEDHLARLPVRERDGDVKRGAGIVPRADGVGQTDAAERRRARKGAVPPQELHPVPGPRCERARVGKGDPPERLVIGILGEER